MTPPHPETSAGRRPVDHRCPEVANDSPQGAFVAGAKWWEWHSTGGTMWASDRDKAWEEAEKRYPGEKLSHATRLQQMRSALEVKMESALLSANHYAVNTTPKAREVCEYWRGRVSALSEALAALAASPEEE